MAGADPFDILDGQLQTYGLVAEANDGNFAPLAKHLREGGQVDDTIRQYLADFLEGKTKRPRGRPKMMNVERIVRRLYRPPELAASVAEDYLKAWRRRKGGQRKFKNRAGKIVSVRDEAIERAIERVRRLSDGANNATFEQVDDLLRHPDKRGNRRQKKRAHI